MEHETCYVYNPASGDAGRSSKRRRVEPRGLQASWTLREKTYQQLWDRQGQRLKSEIQDLHQATVSSVSNFIDSTPHDSDASKLPSAVLVLGPSIASHGALFDQLASSVTSSSRTAFIKVTSAQGSNVKTLLKYIISNASSMPTLDDDDDEEIAVGASAGAQKLLNYDLENLHRVVVEHKLERVVVSFQDAEAFDGGVLSRVVELLHAWRDRISFLLLFGIATLVEVLQTKLSRKATRCIQGHRFQMARADVALEQVFGALFSGDSTLCLGGTVCSQILSRQHDHVQSLQAFVDAVQYAYMAHFYANPLSLFLDTDPKLSQIPKDHFEALRNLPSFALHAEDLITHKKTAVLRRLLDSDPELFTYVREQIDHGQQALVDLVQAAHILHVLHTETLALQPLTKSEVIVESIAGRMKDSTTLRNLFLSLRKLNSSRLSNLSNRMIEMAPETLRTILTELLDELTTLLSEGASDAAPLRSQDDIGDSTLRTTVTAKKISLSKQKATLTKADEAYSAVLLRFCNALTDYFTTVLIDPKTLVFHEIFLYDLRSPHRDVFTPKPRVAVERALSTPQDYLNCSCCGLDRNGEEDGPTLSGSQPPTAVLYQLYMESGAVINAADLRAAFGAILEEEGEDAKVSALFQRSLAELKYMGLVKGTKKKADHIVKLGWRGL